MCVDDATLPPAPGKLTMSKYSPDTILLQWEEEAVHVSPDGETVDHSSNCSSLVGYRVYVNGTEEGIVRICISYNICLFMCTFT